MAISQKLVPDNLALLTSAKDTIPYHREIARALEGDMDATILLRQIIFWFYKMDAKPFFKFKVKCEKHPSYRAGDSWTEELGISRARFDHALKRIATKVTRGSSKTAITSIHRPEFTTCDLVDDDVVHGAACGVLRNSESLVTYWTTSNRLTFYAVNELFLSNVLKWIYLQNSTVALYGPVSGCALHNQR